MQFLKTLTALGLLATSARAAATFEGEYFEVSNITVNRVFSSNFSVSFTIHDPDPLTNATQDCSGSWKYGSNGYPKDSYSLCGSSTFGWNMASFHGYQSFTLGLQHAFVDPSVGDPPYDVVITYGDAVVNRRNLGCKASGESVSCSQKTDVIEAPITRVSA